MTKKKKTILNLRYLLDRTGSISKRFEVKPIDY